MNKEQKEEWILKRFLRLLGNEYKSFERIPEEIASGPDFIVEDNQDNKEGVEVTELLEWPSHKEGQQRILEDEFENNLYKMLDNDRYRSYSFVFYRIPYPSNKEMFKKHVKEIVEKIDSLYQKRELKDRIKFVVNNQKIRVLHNSDKNDSPHFIFFLYSEEGVRSSDRENFFKGLRKRIGDKFHRSKKYIKDYPIHLVIYDNTRYSIFINNIEGEIYKEIGKIKKGYFEHLWLLSGRSLFMIA